MTALAVVLVIGCALWLFALAYFTAVDHKDDAP